MKAGPDEGLGCGLEMPVRHAALAGHRAGATRGNLCSREHASGGQLRPVPGPGPEDAGGRAATARAGNDLSGGAREGDGP